MHSSRSIATTPTSSFRQHLTATILVVLAVAVAWPVGLTVWMEPVPVSAVAPGGNGRIAFQSNIVSQSNPEGDYEIFSMNPNGTDLRQLTENTTKTANIFETDPSWSADRKRLVYARLEAGASDIFTMKANGTNQSNRTSDPSIDSNPDWLEEGGGGALARSRNQKEVQKNGKGKGKGNNDNRRKQGKQPTTPDDARRRGDSVRRSGRERRWQARQTLAER